MIRLTIAILCLALGVFSMCALCGAIGLGIIYLLQ